MNKKAVWVAFGVCFFLALGYYFIPKPKILENFTFSSAVYDRRGKLLRLTLSKDEKYRLFTPVDKIPETMKQALLLYEDKNFYSHHGVDFFSILRAAKNTFAGGRKEGASTITMQLARLIYNIDSSTVAGKMHQMLRAIQLERHYSKEEILEGYFNLAPYGDNIEGVGSASLIYFGHAADKLTLPEALSLAVIPQNPAKRGPSRGQGALDTARRRLADIWKKTYPKEEQNAYLSLPVRFYTKRDIPFAAPHLTGFVLNQNAGDIHTTLDLDLQRRSEEIIQSYIKRNATKGLENAAVFLIDAETMEVLVWAGSADFFNAGILGQVDGTRAQRSPGSAMKPFIYALGLEQGIIHPLSMMKDLPKSYAFYNPENFDRNYKGIVTATTALVYSLNIPAVDLLQQLDKGSFYNLLVRSDVKNLKSEDFYGLALALGGFELSMQEAVKMYAALYNKGVYRALSVIQGEEEKPRQQIFSPESAFLTLQMLKQNLPTDKNNKRPVYWKTGTSYSYKDAWTIGIVDKYVIGVWIGNFDGTPNHSFVGRTAAAPLFFEIVRMMERNIQMPPFVLETRGLNVQKVDICRPTGDIANALCPDILPSWFIPGISPIRLSDVHREIPVDVKTGVRACRHRPPMTKLEVHEFWPSDILKAFEKAGISKKRPPEFGEDCDGFVPYKGQPPSIQYPISDITYVVRSEKLAAEKVPLKAHADTDVRTLYWFLNDVFLGESAPDEMVFFTPKIGRFYIKVVDDKGRSAIRSMSIQLIQ